MKYKPLIFRSVRTPPDRETMLDIKAVFTLYGGFRKDTKAVLNVTPLTGHAVETWIGFLSKDELDASDSVWTGRVEV